MNIELITTKVWRHSLRPLKDYPFYLCNSKKDLRELTRVKLQDDKVTYWLDKLLNRQLGYHNKLANLRVYNSDANHHLDYISSILIDSVIKNDIGLKGGISPVYLLHDNCILGVNNNAVNLEKAKFVNLDTLETDIWSLVDLRYDKDDYIIPYSLQPANINLTISSESIINKTFVDAIEKLLLQNRVISKFSFLALDFFVTYEGLIPFECHYPGRGIGVHFLPFIMNGLMKTDVEKLRSFISTNNGYNCKFFAKNVKQTVFHELDIKFLELLGNPKSRKILEFEIDIDDNKDGIPLRDKEVISNISQFIVTEMLNKEQVDLIKQNLGKWVVVKTRKNTPWWSANSKKPEIILIDEYFVNRINALYSKFGELIIQKLVLDSIDDQGCFGELRAYCLLSN